MLLEARDVTKAFGSFKAVDRASVTLEQGDILGLIGPNGAGKSTLFNCLTGDLLSTSGTVLLEGHDITNLTPEARAHLGLARTVQVPQTFEGMSVLENVMIGAFLRTPHRSEAEAKARAVLERVGLSALANTPAKSLGTPGRKRLEIARRAGACRHEQACRRAGAFARDPRPQAAGNCPGACDRAQGPAAR